MVPKDVDIEYWRSTVKYEILSWIVVLSSVLVPVLFLIYILK